MKDYCAIFDMLTEDYFQIFENIHNFFITKCHDAIFSMISYFLVLYWILASLLVYFGKLEGFLYWMESYFLLLVFVFSLSRIEFKYSYQILITYLLGLFTYMTIGYTLIIMALVFLSTHFWCPQMAYFFLSTQNMHFILINTILHNLLVLFTIPQ